MTVIIKLGGSLADSSILKEWLDCVENSRQDKTVIVPGGGMFAEQVRKSQKQWHFSDEVAHSMAMLAMQQMAMLFQGINRRLQIAGTAEAINHVFRRQQAVIWSPDLAWLEQSEVPASWEVTSDSLAAWLATKMNADQLVLVKSAKIPESATIPQLTEMGIVDKAFSHFIEKGRFDIKFFSRNQITLYRAGSI